MSKQTNTNNDNHSTLITLENLAAAAQTLRSASQQRRQTITVEDVSTDSNWKRYYPSDRKYAVSGGK